MSNMNERLFELEHKISALEARRDDLIARLPAHSIPPSMIAELDEIEDHLNQAKLQMAALMEDKDG